MTLLLRAIDALRELVPEAVAGNERIARVHEDTLDALRLAAADPAASAAAPADDRSHAERRKRPFGRRRDDVEAWLDRSRTLRVDIEKLDCMLGLTGEITIALGRLGQLLRAADAGEAALEAYGDVERLHLELQEQVMAVRLVPIGPTFRSLVRVVRDCAAPLGKRARLEIEGEEVEVDTRVIASLRDPLIHMIRNAVDHGLEPPSVREAAGKDPCGRITLRAARDGGSIVVEVADDGAGFPRERIAARARERGLLGAGETLSARQLERLVLEPGFSTAETVTDLSGRGVGMDVVARNVENLHGSVRIASSEGEGSTVTLRLPLTLAIIAGFGVEAGGETFVLPLDSVVECTELPAAARSAGAASGVLDLRGEALPYARLGDVLALDAPRAERESVVVVHSHGTRAGIVVDGLHGESQTVIKPLGRPFQRIPGLAGSAILASGRVALIVDVPGLLREVIEPACVRLAGFVDRSAQLAPESCPQGG